MFRLDAEPIELGRTRAGAVLGHPLNALVWLARTITAHGVALELGDIILPGFAGAGA